MLLLEMSNISKNVGLRKLLRKFKSVIKLFEKLIFLILGQFVIDTSTSLLLQEEILSRFGKPSKFRIENLFFSKLKYFKFLKFEILNPGICLMCKLTSCPSVCSSLGIQNSSLVPPFAV